MCAPRDNCCRNHATRSSGMACTSDTDGEQFPFDRLRHDSQGIKAGIPVYLRQPGHGRPGRRIADGELHIGMLGLAHEIQQRMLGRRPSFIGILHIEGQNPVRNVSGMAHGDEAQIGKNVLKEELFVEGVKRGSSGYDDPFDIVQECMLKTRLDQDGLDQPANPPFGDAESGDFDHAATLKPVRQVH